MILGFIGTGNIVSDVITGICKSKISYKKIIISPRNKKKAKYLKKKFKKIIIAKNNQAVIDMSDWIFLGVLPQVGEKIFPKLNFKKKQIIISFMSSPNHSRLKKLIKKKCIIVRVIPMPPIRIGKGPVVIFPSNKKIGIVLDFTGPIMSLTPAMASSANLAFKEASESGSFLNGKTIKTIKADTECVASVDATNSTNKIITQGIVAIVGSACPKTTEEILINSAIPNQIIMISPAATSPRLTNFNNNGYFFRTVPSDIRDGQILADITKDKKIKSLAITYTNNYYGKRLSDAYKAAVEAYDIKITAIIPHEDGKTDYYTESSYLASAGGDALAV
ncbi:ABC transporter substrate-binding protein, partial [Candidatus Pelagibacter sp.]|nr:ABC transporter substrate-binding protein [Candidatus Pelagibacter sp.]